jgi:hypothetical protein
MLKKLLISSIVTLTLSGCGGSSSSTEPVSNNLPSIPTAPLTYTGIFLDAAVEGLNYTTESQSGKTNVDGEFIFQLNEDITFSIGDIVLPSVKAATYITPLDIYSTEDISQLEVVNLLRLLQSLDVDGDPSNNIQISDTSHQLATGLTLDFAALDFEQQVADLIANSNVLNQELISADMAIDHFQQTLDGLNNQGVTSCGTAHAKIGYSGDFETFAHNVSGKATIIDDCTIEISQFSYDGGGPDVYMYGAKDHDYNSSSAFSLGPKLNGRVHNNESFLIKLPNGKTLDDLTGLSVWCVDFAADFGHMEFTP